MKKFLFFLFGFSFLLFSFACSSKNNSPTIQDAEDDQLLNRSVHEDGMNSLYYRTTPQAFEETAYYIRWWNAENYRAQKYHYTPTYTFTPTSTPTGSATPKHNWNVTYTPTYTPTQTYTSTPYPSGFIKKYSCKTAPVNVLIPDFLTGDVIWLNGFPDQRKIFLGQLRTHNGMIEMLVVDEFDALYTDPKYEWRNENARAEWVPVFVDENKDGNYFWWVKDKKPDDHYDALPKYEAPWN